MSNKTMVETQADIMRTIIDIQLENAQFNQWLTFLKDGNIQETMDSITQRISLNNDYINTLFNILAKYG